MSIVKHHWCKKVVTVKSQYLNGEVPCRCKWWRRIGYLLILSSLLVQLSGCCTPNYIPGTCPVASPIPVMAQVHWVRICFVNDQGIKVTCFTALASEADINRLKTNFKQKDIYIEDCFSKIGEPIK